MRYSLWLLILSLFSTLPLSAQMADAPAASFKVMTFNCPTTYFNLSLDIISVPLKKGH